MDKRQILKKLDRIDNLPTLPAIAVKVNAMLQDYNSSTDDLAILIEKDQALVPKILKLVNSAFFGLRSRVSNIAHAVMLLGYGTVRNAVVSVAVIDALSIEEKVDGFDIEQFWSHAAAVAVLSRFLTKSLKIKGHEDAFIAGLIHDMGKVVLSSYFTTEFTDVLTESRKNNISFYAAEKKVLGITHTHIGAILSQKWQLPDVLTNSIRHHHQMKKGMDNPDIVMAIHCADILTNIYIDKSADKHEMSNLHPEARTMVLPLLKTVKEWFPAVLEEIDSATAFYLEGHK